MKKDNLWRKSNGESWFTMNIVYGHRITDKQIDKQMDKASC